MPSKQEQEVSSDKMSGKSTLRPPSIKEDVSSSVKARSTGTAAKDQGGGAGVSAAVLPSAEEDGWGADWGTSLDRSVMHLGMESEGQRPPASDKGVEVSEVTHSHPENDRDTGKAQQSDAARGTDEEADAPQSSQPCSSKDVQQDAIAGLQAPSIQGTQESTKHSAEPGTDRSSAAAESPSAAAESTSPSRQPAVDVENAKVQAAAASSEPLQNPSDSGAGQHNPETFPEGSKQAGSPTPPSRNVGSGCCKGEGAGHEAASSSPHAGEDVEEVFVEAGEVHEQSGVSSSTGTPSAEGSGAGGHTASEWSLVSASEALTGMPLSYM
jgi:hypothetical protein